jgi:hypothetical protein
MKVLRLTENQHQQLKRHLFSGDGNESVALALCGRLNNGDREILCVHKIEPVPDEDCVERSETRVQWDPRPFHALFEKAASKGMGILKIHSHPSGFEEFSKTDDHSDRELFKSLHGWTDDGLPHCSAVMLPSGKIFARQVSPEGGFLPVDRIAVAGDSINFFDSQRNNKILEAQTRTAQAFGDATTSQLGVLTIGVVGCSGTGSWVIEQLARLGVGRLILVDPDIVEKKNLNRIVNSSERHAQEGEFKVHALAKILEHHGTGTSVTTYPELIFEREVSDALGACDVLFGCVDSIEGRNFLNRIATFYSIPYFDLGVRLDADGEGGVSNVSAVVNYLIPDGSSLLSRKSYSAESLRVDSLRRCDPERYADEEKEGYIKGSKVESPAVISVNGFCATAAVNEFLARIHPFRLGNLSEERQQQFDLVNSFWIYKGHSASCPLLSPKAGRGNMSPYLDQVTS